MIIFFLAYKNNLFYFFKSNIGINEKIAIKDCVFGGGVWQPLPDTCVDNCREFRLRNQTKTTEKKSKPEPKSFSLDTDSTNTNSNWYCGMSETRGCDCGPQKCWNKEEKKCESN